MTRRIAFGSGRSTAVRPTPDPVILQRAVRQTVICCLFAAATVAGSLLAQPFDPVASRRVATPVTVAEHVAVYDDLAGSAASLSPRPGRSCLTAHASSREWNGMTGPGDRPARSESPPYAGPTPVARRLPNRFQQYDPVTATTQVWIADVPRGVETRLTSPPGSNATPCGRPMVHVSRIHPMRSIRQTFRSGWQMAPVRAAAVTDEPGQRWPMDWSSDGRVLIASDREPAGERLVGISAFPLDGERRPFTVVPRRASNIVGASLSADRRWLAYDTDEIGAA